jgi:poly(3-hydroxybutyrate) depolymerase
MSFEQHLRRALRRKDPPAGFLQRVLTRIGDERRADSEVVGLAGGGRLMSWLAAAAAVLLIVIGVAQYRTQQQMREQAAKAQVMSAFQIASEKLEMVRIIVGRNN